MRFLHLITFIVFSVTACFAETQYRSAAEFEAVVKSWQLEGKLESEAITLLAKKNFSCKKRVCYHEVGGFPCMQKLQVTLVLNSKGEVTKANIWKMPNGKLPDVCL